MKTRNILCAIILCFPYALSAQIFTSGGISYNVLSPEEHTVEVVAQSNAVYHGNINIPSSVVYEDSTYDVVALGEWAFYGASLSGVSIPPSVTQIKESCFRDASGLATINIPASVTNVETWAFAATGLNAINVDEDNADYISINGILFSKDTSTLVECPRGKSGVITLPQATRIISPCAFFECRSITGVSLPEGLVCIDFWAFMEATRLNNIVIPSSVSCIGVNLFGGCSSLTNITIADGNTHYYMDGYAIYSTAGDTLISYHKSADSVFLPNTLRVVSGFGFNTDVKYIHVPEGVTTIAANAFTSSSLKSIDLPSHLDRIEAYAFDYCTSMTNVTMPSTLDTMGRACFELCSSLSSITIPNGLRTVSREAFIYCTSLIDITWGNDIETIDSYAFGNCRMASLQFPASLKVIRYEAFWKGRKLKKVAFSEPIDTIEFGAFNEHSIKTLQLKNTVPPTTTGEDDYYGCLYGTTVDTIVIPCGSLEAYLSDDYWSQFADKYVEDDNCDGIIGVTDSRHAAVGVYPNPTTDVVYIQLNSDAFTQPENHQSPITITLYNAKGQPLKIQNSEFKPQNSLDISDVPSGIYYLTITTTHETVTRKIVKQ